MGWHVFGAKSADISTHLKRAAQAIRDNGAHDCARAGASTPTQREFQRRLLPESPTKSELLVAFRAIFPSEVFRPGNGRISADAHATFTG
jgi:hypothetical protein